MLPLPCMQRDKEGSSSSSDKSCLSGMTCNPWLFVFASFCGLLTFIFVRITVDSIHGLVQVFFGLFVFCGIMALSICLQEKKAEVLPRSDFGKRWKDIEIGRRNDWQKIGYTQELWDSDKVPDWCAKRWYQLPQDVQAAVSRLGYNERTWDMEAKDGKTEHDPLMHCPGKFRGGKEQVRLARGSAWKVVIVSSEVTAMLWFLYTLFGILYLTGYHSMPMFLSVFTTITVFVLLLASQIIEMRRPLSKGDREIKLLLRLCAGAIVLGSLVGFSITSARLTDYWPYDAMRHYSNVAPDELASAHADASAIVFMEGTKPDIARVTRYRRHGSTYCVVPISLDASYTDDTEVASDIQYWAAGKDCCLGSRKGFTCDDAANSKARSGLVMFGERKTWLEDLLSGVLWENDYSHYEQAIKMGKAKFGITSPKQHLIMRWVHDLGEARSSLWNRALRSWFQAAAWGFFLAFVCGALVPLLVLRDEYKIDINAFKQLVLKAANHHPSNVYKSFSDQ